MSSARKRLLRRICSIPTAPYREHYVRAFIREFCRQRKIQFIEDQYGNIIASYGNPYKNPLFAFSAHMDHPGFIVEKNSTKGKTTALFYGGVDKQYFSKAPVRFFSGKQEITAIVKRVQNVRNNRCRKVLLQVSGNVKAGDMGMWDLNAYNEERNLIHSRACDDLVGCSAIVSLLDECVKKRVKQRFLAVFTTAEESGLHGAKQLCRSQLLPDESIMISVETSSQLPGMSPGDGVIVRVGDKVSVFDSTVLSFINDYATSLRQKKITFSFQRKLMDGGRCEASVYQNFGFKTGAVCIPLAHYHNRNNKTMHIQQEYVHYNDYSNMIDLCLSMVQNASSFSPSCKRPDYKTLCGSLGEYFLWEH